MSPVEAQILERSFASWTSLAPEIRAAEVVEKLHLPRHISPWVSLAMREMPFWAQGPSNYGDMANAIHKIAPAIRKHLRMESAQ